MAGRGLKRVGMSRPRECWLLLPALWSLNWRMVPLMHGNRPTIGAVCAVDQASLQERGGRASSRTPCRRRRGGALWGKAEVRGEFLRVHTDFTCEEWQTSWDRGRLSGIIGIPPLAIIGWPSLAAVVRCLPQAGAMCANLPDTNVRGNGVACQLIQLLLSPFWPKSPPAWGRHKLIGLFSHVCMCMVSPDGKFPFPLQAFRVLISATCLP